jgi:uncharacterized coiled-coil protein SlyX
LRNRAFAAHLQSKTFAMNNLFQTDESRVLLYLSENDGWLKTISIQSKEIPVLEKMLVETEPGIDNDKSMEEKVHFKNELTFQQEQMKQLNTALDEQQQRLEKDAARKSLYDINALRSQDILRDRIREVEKRYIELKCNFMKFLSGVI